MPLRSDGFLVGLISELRAQPKETEWVEFKVNDAGPQSIGEYISALSNSAALLGKSFAYMIWGVRDEDHALVGTSFHPGSTKKGNEELENWLLRQLQPKLDFSFFEVAVDGVRAIVLEVPPASGQPTRFSGEEYVRVGSYKKKLRDFPDKERALWRRFDQVPFESGVAVDRVDGPKVLQLLDYPAYFDLLERPLPEDRGGILSALSDDGLIRPSDAGGWDVTNLGAILFAKELKELRPLRRKAVRVVLYRGNDRTRAIREQEGAKGYASGFEGLVSFINGLLPSNEVVGQALRKVVPMFPGLAVRELVANALIHQDFSVTGAGPMIEIFDDRLEITNPGEPLVDTRRFVDTVPQSRNETLAALMRRFRICEERGSGIDRVVSEVELFQLPAPLFETPAGATRAILFAHKPLSAMNRGEKMRACYLHACLCYVTQKAMTNSTLRARFGIEERNRATISRLIGEAVKAGEIVSADPHAAPKEKRYLPFWAKPGVGVT